MGLWNFLVTSQMEPEDDFRQRLRKSVMGVLFLVGLALVGYSIRGFLIETYWAPMLTFITVFFEAVIFVGGYIAMRVGRHVSDSNASFVLWASVGITSVAHLVIVQFDMKSLVVAQASLGVMVQIKGLPAYLVVLSFFMVLHDWNKAHLITQVPDQMLTLPNPIDDGSSITVLIGFLLGSLLTGGCVSMFHNQVVESERRGAAQQAANEMTMKVLQRHRKYDTEGVSKILEECTEESVVDPALIALFEGMNGNLESYRPFLPNYLFQQDESSGEEGEGELNHDDSEGKIPMLEESTRSAVSGRSGSNLGGSYRSPHHPIRAEPTDSPVTHPSLSQEARLALNKRGHLFEGRITYALVDVCVNRFDKRVSSPSTSPGNLPLRPHTSDNDRHATALTFLVTQLYAIAKETKASVHSMLGDTVQLTWNATNNVALPETKGVQFLSRLVAAFSSSIPQSCKLAIRGAVNSGRATVHNITANHQQALLIDAPWLPALEGTFHLAKRGSGSLILMDERTMKGSQMEVTSCAVEQVFTTPPDAADAGSAFTFLCHEPRCGSLPHAGPGTMLYQILGEKVRTDDEWMYQLQQDGDECSANNATTHKNAIAAVVDGQFKEALALLETIVEDKQSKRTTHFRSALLRLCQEKMR